MNLFETDLLSDDIKAYASQAFPEDRDFQKVAFQRIRELILEGHRAIVLMSPTGSGKTHLGMQFINLTLSKGNRALFACDRVSLIDQTSAVAYRYGLEGHGIIQADHPLTSPRLPFQIASAQTLDRRGWPDGIRKPRVVVIDECHTVYKSWSEYMKKCLADPNDKTVFIGLSATPFTKGLGKLFSAVVNAASTASLIERGILTPFRVFRSKRIDMSGLGKGTSEWTAGEVTERGVKIVGDVVQEWKDHAEDRKTICFASSKVHAREISRQFNEAGVMSMVYVEDTPDVERKQMLKEFSKPAGETPLKVLVSVDALAKGFDQPDVGCVIICRPLRKSFSTHIQMLGRGLRSAEGKVDCVVLDHTGNWDRFYEDFEPYYHNGIDVLDDGNKLDQKIRKDPEEKEIRACPQCGSKPFFKHCRSCGHSTPEKTTVHHKEGRLSEFVMGNKAVPEAHQWDLYCQLAAYAAKQGAAKGKTQDQIEGRAYHLFSEIAKTPLPRGFKFSAVPKKTVVTEAVEKKIRNLNKQFMLKQRLGYKPGTMRSATTQTSGATNES